VAGNGCHLPLSVPHTYGLTPPIRSLTLGFCGKHFPIWVDFELPLDIGGLADHDKQKRWLSLEEALEKYQKFVAESNPWKLSGKPDWEYRRRLIVEHHRRVRKAPANVAPFRVLRCPIYVVARLDNSWREPATVQIVTNPRLSNLGFERVLDSFSAFQTIATFLDNELATTEAGPDTVGGDEVVARAKGFDEHSFRTSAPGQKKQNRQANRERKRAR
jgi:hypothetical protein